MAMALLIKMCIALITVAINENAKIKIAKAKIRPIPPVKNEAIMRANIVPESKVGP